MERAQVSLRGFNTTMSGVKRALSKVVHINGEGRRASSEHGSPSTKPGDHKDHSPSPFSPHRKSMGAFFKDKESAVSSSENESSDYDSDGQAMSKNEKKRRARKAQHESVSRQSAESRDASQERAKKRLEEAAKTETDEMKSRYGPLPLMQSNARSTDKRINIEIIDEDMVDKEVTFRARLHHVRAMGPKLVFLIFRQQVNTIQGVLHQQQGVISEVMLHWAEHVRTGSVMLVKGVVQKPAVPVKSATIHEVEVVLSELKLVTARAEPGKQPPRTSHLLSFLC